MRTIAAICLSAFVGACSFIPISTNTKEKHVPWKSLHPSVKPIPSAPRADLLTEQSLQPLSAYVVALSSAVTVTTISPPAPQPVDSVTPELLAEWTKVSVCENGAPGWNPPQGSMYPDSLGINATNWYGNGGGSDLSPAAQIAVAEKIQTNPPDQGGCTGSW